MLLAQQCQGFAGPNKGFAAAYMPIDAICPKIFLELLT
jgi:hypothetical protein